MIDLEAFSAGGYVANTCAKTQLSHQEYVVEDDDVLCALQIAVDYTHVWHHFYWEENADDRAK